MTGQTTNPNYGFRRSRSNYRADEGRASSTFIHDRQLHFSTGSILRCPTIPSVDRHLIQSGFAFWGRECPPSRWQSPSASRSEVDLEAPGQNLLCRCSDCLLLQLFAMLSSQCIVARVGSRPPRSAIFRHPYIRHPYIGSRTYCIEPRTSKEASQTLPERKLPRPGQGERRQVCPGWTHSHCPFEAGTSRMIRRGQSEPTSAGKDAGVRVSHRGATRVLSPQPETQIAKDSVRITSLEGRPTR